jgi:hypothetical protein
MSSDDDTDGTASDDSDHTSPVLSLRASLDELAVSRTGLRFVYGALAILAKHFGLRDAVVVLEGEGNATQIFRLGGKAVSRTFASQSGMSPGVYCDPPVVGAEEFQEIMIACQRALTQSRTPRATHTEPTEEPSVGPSHDRVAVATVMERRSRFMRQITNASDASPSPRYRVDPRRFLSRLLVVVDVATFVMTVSNIQGPSRFFLGLILGIAIPGWSVVGLLRLRNGALEVGLTMATSLSLIMISAQILMTANLWHLIAFEKFTCVACLPSLLWQSGLRPRRRVLAK